MSTGLIIGKFLPPHAGHQCLIDTARMQVSALSVIVFSKAAEPIPGSLRAAWLRELYPTLSILHIDREGPVDFDDEGAWQFWVATIRAAHPRPVDVVFSSEAYGDELARRLGARHVLVDPSRTCVPVSGSQIRADPLAHWEALPAPVRAFYLRRVALVGAESTGKTTLARALAAHFDTVWVPEFAREYLEARGGVCTLEDMPRIAQGQAALEDCLGRQANRVLIQDTNLLTTQLWHEHYFGEAPAALRQMAAERRADLYLLCDCDVPWMADGLRDSPRQRRWFQDRFRSELEAARLPYVVLAGPFEERLGPAVEAVTHLLQAPGGHRNSDTGWLA
jgi:NadR type nicotinamide-nucleotide adenylyltransferase